MVIFGIIVSKFHYVELVVLAVLLLVLIFCIILNAYYGRKAKQDDKATITRQGAKDIDRVSLPYIIEKIDQEINVQKLKSKNYVTVIFHGPKLSAVQSALEDEYVARGYLIEKDKNSFRITW